jgi:hypothetical protein
MTSIVDLGLQPQVRRRVRSPQHPFRIDHAPFQITPFFIAPVLPGETMKNLSLQSRVLTEPLKSSLIGWWIEHYVFYVKHRDLEEPDTFTNLLLDASADLSGSQDYDAVGAADAFYGRTVGVIGMDWVKACARVCIAEFFRDEGEAWDAVLIDSKPAAYINQTNWLQSATPDSDMSSVDVTIPEQAADAGILVSDVEKAMRQYELLRAQGLVNMTYEDYLRSFGVRTQRAVVNRPELVRYSRSWTYPSSHVVPSSTTSGASSVTSACSWSIEERADKDRFFAEPGFLIGFTCARPKVYFTQLHSPAVTLMDDAYSWLPAMLANDTRASWKKITDAATDILGGVATGNWWIDLKDLLIYGDQFVNTTANNINGFSLPGAGVDPRHPVQASVDALFISGDATSGVHQDGLVRLQVLGHQLDTSPRGSVTGRVA